MSLSTALPSSASAPVGPRGTESDRHGRHRRATGALPPIGQPFHATVPSTTLLTPPPPPPPDTDRGRPRRLRRRRPRRQPPSRGYPPPSLPTAPSVKRAPSIRSRGSVARWCVHARQARRTASAAFRPCHHNVLMARDGARRGPATPPPPPAGLFPLLFIRRHCRRRWHDSERAACSGWAGRLDCRRPAGSATVPPPLLIPPPRPGQ